MFPQCYVCNDYKKVELESREYEIAYQHLSRVTRRLDVPRDLRILDTREYRKYFIGLDINRPNVRLRCGRACNKVSTQSSKRTFNLLKDECKKVVYYLINCTDENEFKKIKREALSIVRGFNLSKFYRSIESIKFKGV